MAKTSLANTELCEKGVSCVSCEKILTDSEISKIPNPVDARGIHLNTTCPGCGAGAWVLNEERGFKE